MLNNVGHLIGCSITATDGPIGHVESAFFDDSEWAIRYLVVETGTWLSGRKVLISPYSLKQPLDRDKNLDVTLRCDQVRNSPDIDTHQPVSRQHERQYLDYYGYPQYWEGGGLWAMGSFPFLPLVLPPAQGAGIGVAMHRRDVRAGDVHLRSSAKVTGYRVQASDDGIGHVEDFIFDDESWAIRYLVIDTSGWWSEGRKVLIGTRWIDNIDWSTESATVKLTREQVRSAMTYDAPGTITRDYEQRLHAAHGRAGYWE